MRSKLAECGHFWQRVLRSYGWPNLAVVVVYVLLLQYKNIGWNALYFTRQFCVLGFFTLGAGWIALSGGIDLCFMAQAALSTVLAASAYHWGLPIVVIVAVVVLFNVAVGAARGWLIEKLQVLAIIFTLALATVFSNLGAPDQFLIMGIRTYRYYTPFTLAMLAVLLLCAAGVQFYLHRTWWGKYALAMRENIGAVRACGVNTRSLSSIVYGGASLLFAFGTLMMLFVAPYGSSSRDSSYLYQVLAAVGLGGGFSHRRKSREMAGLLAGAVSMTMIEQLLQYLGLGHYRLIVEGAVILVALFTQIDEKK